MSTKKKIYFWLIFFTGVSLVFLVFVIPKLLGEIRGNSEDLIDLRGQLVLLQKEAKNLDELEKVYQSHQSTLEKIDTLFIDPKMPLDFINFLDKEAQLSSLKIEISLTPTIKKESDPWPSLTLMISTYGSLPNLLRFLGKIENSPYLIEIGNLDVKRLTEIDIQSTKYPGILTGDVEASLSIKAFTH